VAKRKNNERDLVRRPCVDYMRGIKPYVKGKVYVVSPPDLGFVAEGWRIAALKKDGYEKGVFDMNIVHVKGDIVKVWLIEFKYGKNDYTVEQKEVAEMFECTPVNTIKIYSLAEFQDWCDKELL
jgi:hypothetical protein